MEAEQTPHEVVVEEGNEVEERVRHANAQAARYRIERNAARQELATLTQRMDEATAQIAVEQQQRWRIEAVARVGLPPEMAERLHGDSPETLSDDAVRLAQLFPVRKNTRTHAAHATHAPTLTRAQQIVNRIEGRQDNPFDVLLQKSLGGGAINED